MFPPDRVELANQIFSDALDHPAEERDSFVRARCTNDEALCHSVLVLLSQYGRLGDFLETPAASPSQTQFRESDVICGRFQIEAAIGSGGMGEVYRARDEQLGEAIALKILRPRWRGEDSFAARFRDEIRLSRKVAHPNVCRIFDLYVEHRGVEEILCFTMELLKGETLAQRLAWGKMDLDQTLTLARQIAAGLDAAHAIGVMHRDLKPANIMLTKTANGIERAVIMDFGLAKAFDAADAPSGQTQAGQFLGTPEYAAPEQFLASAVTPAADVYSFAVVVYEMLSQRRPFPQEDVIRAAIRRTTQPAEPLSQVVPSVPASWSAAFARGLDVNPTKRFPTAQALVDELEKGRGGRATIRLALTAHRRFLLWASAGAIFLAVLFVALRLLVWGPALPPGSSVLLTPIQNLTGQPILEGVTTLLRQQIAQSAKINPEPESQIRATLDAMHRQAGGKLDEITAREVALRTRVPLVIYGNLSRLGTDYDLAMKIEAVGDRPVFSRGSWRRTFSASSRDAIPTSLESAARWVREVAGEAGTSIAKFDRPPDQTTTASWDALEAFDKATKLADAGSFDLALASLGEAVRLDPNFALAEMRLGDLLSTLRREAEAQQHYSRAIALASAGHLTRKEDLLLKGNYYSDMGAYPEAEQVLREFVQEYPYEYRASFLLANALRMRGQLAESTSEFWRAEAKNHNASNVLNNLAMNYLIAGQYGEVDHVAKRMESADDRDSAFYQRAAADFLRGHQRQAISTFEELTRSKDADLASRAFSREAQGLAESGRWPEAEQALGAGIQHDVGANDAGRRTEKQLALAFLRLRAGDRATARTASLDAVAGDPSIRQLIKAGSILAWSGFLPEAEEISKRLPPADSSPAVARARLRVEGELLLARGRIREAMSTFEELDRTDVPLFNRLYLARAYRAAGDMARAQERCRAALATPGLFWIYADYELPTVVSYSCPASK